MRPPVIGAIGCSGPVAEHFVSGFIEEGAHLRLLARNPAKAAERYPLAEIVKGSMMEPSDVAGLANGADAIFLVTPMGMNDDPSSGCCQSNRNLSLVGRSYPLRHVRSGHEVLPLSQCG